MRGDTWWAAVSGVEPVGRRAWFFSGLFPDTGPCGYHHGGWGRRGGGTCSPSPVSHASNHLTPLPAGHPYSSAGTPTPGAGSVLAIPGGQPYPGWSRRETVSGSSPGSPHAVDRVDIATGGGADGEGELVPPPLSPTLQPSYFSPAPPPRPRLRRSSPAHPGRWQCLRYQGSSRAREQRWKSFPERLGVASPYPVLPQYFPMHWTMVALAIGGGCLRGGGTLPPSPVSHAL